MKKIRDRIAAVLQQSDFRASGWKVLLLTVLSVVIACIVVLLSVFFSNRVLFLFCNIRLFSVVFPPLLLLIAAFYAFNRCLPRDIPVIRWFSNAVHVKDKFILSGMVVLLLSIIFLLSLTRYNSYSSNFDLAIYDQIICNSAHGRLFLSSIMGDCNFLGNHFGLVLLLFAPLYRIFPNRITLLSRSRRRRAAYKRME
jgi:hypothetical protein